MRLAQRIVRSKASPTTAFIPLLRQLRQAGTDVLNLAIGEPEFATPASVVTATAQALQDGFTRYDAASGVTALRQRLAADFEGLGAENIVVTNGAKQALFSIFQTICDPGDEVILPVPCWVSFTAQVRLAGAEAVSVACRGDHQLDMAAIARAISPRTRAIVVNSPNNPTGAVYPRQTFADLASLARENDFYLVADEAYRDFVYPPHKAFDPWRLADIRDRLIVVRSFSKTAAMTGFRVGYVAAAGDLARALERLQSHLCGNVCTFAQYGALAAAGEAPWLKTWLAKLDERRRYAYAQATALFDCVPPQGAFYLFPDVRRRLAKGQSSHDFAMELLRQTGVAMVPGEAFGTPGHVRICYAVSAETLAEAFARLRKHL
ncbi:MAG: pyridoxal phosphate-dependent aminotransferase [Deltaproteobacteria bacterium]|nr:pyridoxal phosphate-dependent aminotransferase [Deltaproteobacteria bacterium]RLB97811.1 MAG: pyridoxal phosphate-dependent aminotransferase [Deltaproteobacteria bacterium]